MFGLKRVDQYDGAWEWHCSRTSFFSIITLGLLASAPQAFSEDKPDAVRYLVFTLATFAAVWLLGVRLAAEHYASRGPLHGVPFRQRIRQIVVNTTLIAFLFGSAVGLAFSHLPLSAGSPGALTCTLVGFAAGLFYLVFGGAMAAHRPDLVALEESFEEHKATYARRRSRYSQ